MTSKKSWHEKLHDAKGLPKVVRLPDGKGTMVVPAPVEVDALMRRVRKGRATTIAELRDRLARRHGTTIACPLTTGIFAWIAAHAAEEAREAGIKAVTPWWRTLKTGRFLNEKYPGGLKRQKKLLEAEGHRIERRGTRMVVAAAKTLQRD
ncbi:MAG: MGMT family protein [Planctomycetes bacterium]|nr:MGMT family protein [Planctomycetota bacterium]